MMAMTLLIGFVNEYVIYVGVFPFYKLTQYKFTVVNLRSIIMDNRISTNYVLSA